MEHKTADYLLRFYPSLWRQVRDQQNDAIFGNVATDLTAGRYGQGGYSDPTGNRALLLADSHDLSRKLGFVRLWIDMQLPTEDRHLLLSTWRSNKYGGWWWVSKELSKGVAECHERWDRLIDQLANWLDKMF